MTAEYSCHGRGEKTEDLVYTVLNRAVASEHNVNRQVCSGEKSF